MRSAENARHPRQHADEPRVHVGGLVGVVVAQEVVEAVLGRRPGRRGSASRVRRLNSVVSGSIGRPPAAAASPVCSAVAARLAGRPARDGARSRVCGSGRGPSRCTSRRAALSASHTSFLDRSRGSGGRWCIGAAVLGQVDEAAARGRQQAGVDVHLGAADGVIIAVPSARSAEHGERRRSSQGNSEEEQAHGLTCDNGRREILVERARARDHPVHPRGGAVQPLDAIGLTLGPDVDAAQGALLRRRPIS